MQGCVTACMGMCRQLGLWLLGPVWLGRGKDAKQPELMIQPKWI